MTINQEEEETYLYQDEYPRCMACNNIIGAYDTCYQIVKGQFNPAVEFHLSEEDAVYLCPECHARLLEASQ